MNFSDAHALLQQIAEGRYNSISYSVTTKAGGQLEQSCHLYLDPCTSVDGDTWESSFEQLNNVLSGEAAVIVDAVPQLESGAKGHEEKITQQPVSTKTPLGAPVVTKGNATQRALAARCQIAPSYMSDILSGKKRPSAKLALKMELSLGVEKMIWLFGTPDQLKEALEVSLGKKINSRRGRPFRRATERKLVSEDQ